MLFIESPGKIYYCPLKDNRQIDDSDGGKKFCRADALSRAPDEQVRNSEVHRFLWFSRKP